MAVVIFIFIAHCTVHIRYCWHNCCCCSIRTTQCEAHKSHPPGRRQTTTIMVAALREITSFALVTIHVLRSPMLTQYPNFVDCRWQKTSRGPYRAACAFGCCCGVPQPKLGKGGILSSWLWRLRRVKYSKFIDRPFSVPSQSVVVRCRRMTTCCSGVEGPLIPIRTYFGNIVCLTAFGLMLFAAHIGNYV